MVDIIDKVFNLGIGAIVMTKEKAESIVNDLIRSGEVGQEEAKKMVRELMEKGEKRKAELREEIKRTVREYISEMNIASKTDVKNLESEIELLRNSKPAEAEIYELKSDIARIKAQINM